MPPSRHMDTFLNITHQPAMIAKSNSMREIRAYISRISTLECTVLITGETGTGKELAAELVHRNSLRSRKPFVCINCVALPDNLIESELFGYERGAFTGAVTTKQGKFELAEGGTLFLDEISDMNLYAQAKILRALEKKEIHRLGGRRGISLDVRVIAATNQKLEKLVKQRRFRKDLYYRLNVARIDLPPLRERKEDIPHLLDHYLPIFNDRFGRDVKGFSVEALSHLLCYSWPGNVRELINLLEATFINLPSRTITYMDLPKVFRKQLKETEGLPERERDRILSALFATNWNKSKAAQKLHCSRMTLYRKMEKYNIVNEMQI